MREKRWRPRLSTEFKAALRRHAGDIVAAVLLYGAVSLAVGRVFRFVFDDEVYSLDVAGTLPLGRIVALYSTGRDVHPPLAYIVTWLLHALGLGEAGMRLVALALTALALSLFLVLTLMLLARRGAVTPFARAAAVLLFGLNALAISQGDALRWYPLFAAEVAVAVTLYVAAANDAARLAAAAMVGVAASTNFLAAFVVAPLAIYRYGLERRFAWRVDAALWLTVLVFGGLGVAAAVSVLAGHPQLVGRQLGTSMATAVGLDVLGFFGGHALGLGQAWIVLPAILVSLAAAFGVVDRKQRADPAHLFLIMLIAVAPLPLFGFGKPRSFLYLAPMLAAVQVLYLDRLAQRRVAAALIAMALLVAPAVAAIANIQGTTHPFKREAVVPYDELVAAIDANAEGRVLVVSSDPALAWILTHQRARPERCVSYFFGNPVCFADTGGYGTIVIVGGHQARAANVTVGHRTGRIAALVAGRRKVATVPVGHDADAALKSRLTGTPLTAALLTLDIYR